MRSPGGDAKMIDVALSRIVIREGSDQQYIFLQESRGERGFPIVIGTAEACEIRRVVAGLPTPRPLTHQLAYETIRALGTELKHVDIVDLRDNTFFAQLVLHNKEGQLTAVVDARPSDAVALALRAKCPIRVAQSVLEMVRTDTSGPDPLQAPDEEGQKPTGEETKPDVEKSQEEEKGEGPVEEA